MKKHRLALVVCALVIVTLASASSWEGSAMAGSYGDFPPSGYYAACNSFPRNTSVEVVNLENGRAVTVIVTRGLEGSGVFMMLSVEAAGAIGLAPGSVARVRASSPRSAVELAPPASGSSFDPDINPRQLAAQELRRLGYELEPSGTAVFAQRPAVSPPRVEPSPAPASKVGTPEPAPPLVETRPSVPAPTVASAPTASPPARAETRPATAEAPAAIGLTAPAPAAPGGVGLAVAEPQPKGAERPESLASSKPKPVRTIVLPQLPEPGLPAQAKREAPSAAVAPEAAAVPEVVATVLPVPDEAPLRVEAPVSPKRYEAPALRPEVSGLPRTPARVAPPELALLEPALRLDEQPAATAVARSAPGYADSAVDLELSDPRAPSDSRAESYGRTVPPYIAGTSDAALYDPAAPAASRALAFDRKAPAYAAGRPWPELAWPELEADEIPEVVLAGLSAPIVPIPATSLAEGEIRLPDRIGPRAVALESPAFAAAETQVALAEAEAEAAESPSVLAGPGSRPWPESGDAYLAEAEAKAAESPLALGRDGLKPIGATGEAALAEAQPQPDISTPGAVSPLSTEPGAELAEAQESAGPEALADARRSPDGASLGRSLDEAREQAPETAPYKGSPEAEPAPSVALSAPEEYVIAIEPTSPRPPVAPATATPAPVRPTVPEAAKPQETAKPVAAATTPPSLATGSLEKGRYYIQVGAFGSKAAALENASRLGGGFPTLIEMSGSAGKETWRVFVGPLSRDESGVALVRVRALGYKDAFVKRGS